MGAVAYLPWIHFENDFRVGEFEFLRVDARNNTVPTLPKPYDQIVNVSLLPNNRAIREFTVVKKIAGSLIDDLTEADIESLYQVVELVILAGISTRDISGHYYVNSENFNLYIQRFDVIPINHLSIRSKRRGSALWNGYPIGLYSFKCPEHVSPVKNYKLDRVFLDALADMVLNKKDGWKRIFDATENFNLANTDYVRIRDNSEFVLLCGAFERLLKCNGKAQTFRYKLASEFKGVPKQDIALCRKVLPTLPCSLKKCIARATAGRFFVKDAFDTCKTLLDFWAIDFYRMRNKFAHGERDDRTTIWNAQEHLVLSSHIFPLLVKLYLTKRRLFTMRPLEDNRGLFQFDFFLMRDDLLVEDANFDTGWSKAKMDAVMTGSGSFPTY